MAPFFIKHPIIASVISILTTMLGIICALALPISQFPDIAPITINLTASYPGANSTEVADSVAGPIELQLSGIPDMDYMNSTSSNNGTCSINVIFSPGTDPATAQQLTYMRYAQAIPQLPSVVSQMGVLVKQNPGLPLMIYALDSPNGFYAPSDLAGYAYINLVDTLKRVEGVADVNVFGARFAVRIWLDTEKMAQRDISVNEVYNAVDTQNKINPGGSVGAEPMPDGQEFTFTIRNKGRLGSVDEFNDIIIQQNGTRAVRLSDIATVELGAEYYSVASRVSGNLATAVAIYQTADANAIDTIDRLRSILKEKENNMPEGMRGFISLDTTTPVRESLEEIAYTFIEALALVVLVVFVFLQGFRATLIPLIAVPVSLITTFCFFPILGFTLNTVCLLGMVLAIGLVVDDAIVVVEAVESHLEKGMNPRQATFAAMKEVSGPVIAIALVLAAVFLPSVLLPGITGTLFQQFAVTIAISMLISAFNALTLSPALCALMLKPKTGKKTLLSPLYNAFNSGYEWIANKFASACHFLCKKLWLSMGLLAALTAAIIPVAQQVPGGFLPDEDQGYLICGLIMTPGVSLQRSSEQAQKIEKVIAANQNVDVVTTIIGMNVIIGVQTTNAVTMFVTLKAFKERPLIDGSTHSAKVIAENLNGALMMSGCDGTAFVVTPPAIPGVGASNGVSFVVQGLEGQSVQALYEQVKRVEDALLKQPEVIATASDMMLPAVPQKSIAIDIDKCLAQGVDYAAANQLLQCFNGSMFVNYYSEFGQQWQVYLQAAGSNRRNIDQIANFYTSNTKGESVPLSALVTIKEITDTEFVMHNNIYNSGKISVTPAPGKSSAQAMVLIEKTFAEVIDTTKWQMEYIDMSFQEQKMQDGLGLGSIFALSGIFAFLIMAALYEKWTIPISIFLSIPVAILGAYLGLWLTGFELNIYAQIGLVMLVGLSAKNAILIVEFAILQMERGDSLMEAAVTASRMRLRPILMTSFAFILGCTPLLTAAGSGALARNVLGIVVVIGMTVGSAIGIFFIAPAFVFVMKLFGTKIHAHRHGPDPDEVAAYAALEADEVKENDMK